MGTGDSVGGHDGDDDGDDGISSDGEASTQCICIWHMAVNFSTCAQRWDRIHKHTATRPIGHPGVRFT